MKHSFKRLLALVIALVLAMPTFAFAENPTEIISADIEPPVAEAGAFQLGDTDEDTSTGLTVEYEEIVEELPEMTIEDALGDPDPEEPAQPVSVAFDVNPETAVVTVFDANGEAIPPQEDGAFLLLPGEYTYTAEAEGYVSVENVPFTVSDEPLTLSVALEPSSEGSLPEGAGTRSVIEGVVPEEVGAAVPEEVPSEEGDAAAPEAAAAFDQSMLVGDVVVTVRAEPGVFPAGAELSVKRVPVYRRRQAEAAIEDVRDDDVNVAVSYTFDIKVIDPITKEEIQPAEGQTVSVSFALSRVADENLTTSVYHIDSSGEAEKLDVVQEDEVTAVVETNGFSLYTVEFTYNNLEYVLPGDTSVPMSEILAALGLTGAVQDVAVSNASLFSASNDTGEWIVTAHQAFSTTEWMKVTINGVVYEITVTDDDEEPEIILPDGDSYVFTSNDIMPTVELRWGDQQEPLRDFITFASVEYYHFKSPLAQC